jgi:hypothetical protein
VNSTPRLWSKVYFSGCGRDPTSRFDDNRRGRQRCSTLAQLQTAVARTVPGPLDIAVKLGHPIYWDTEDDCPTCWPSLKQLTQCDVERWTSLIDTPSHLHSAPWSLFQGRFLALRELTVSNECRSGIFWAGEVLGNAPALEAVYLTLHGPGPNDPPDLPQLSFFTWLDGWLQLRRLEISVKGDNKVATQELVQKCTNLEELMLSPAGLTGVKVTPASSKFLRRLTLNTAGLPEIPPVLASLPVLVCLTLTCSSSDGPRPRKSITLPALREFSMTGRFHFLPCILAPNLHALRLEYGAYGSTPETFINAAWDTTRARTNMLQPSHLTVKNVNIQSDVLLTVLKQNPQLTTFNYHGGFPSASFFEHLGKDSENTAPKLENIYLRETVSVTPWQAIRSPILAIVQARYGPGKTLKSLFCISKWGDEEIAMGWEFCV